MNYFRVQSALIAGLQAASVKVECAQSRRLPYLQILGGSGCAGGELRERVIAALGTIPREKFRLPARRFTIQINPAARALPLESLDLAVAVALLGSCGQISASRAENLLICGRLGLDGRISLAGGESAVRRLLREEPFSSAILPWEASEVLEDRHLARGGGFTHLEQVLEFLRGSNPGKRRSRDLEEEVPAASGIWDRIAGQEMGKRVIEVAAAGSHHLLLPGATPARADLLAHALSSLLPPLTVGEAEEVREIYALAGMAGRHPSRPFHAFGSHVALPGLLLDRRLAGVEDALLAHRGVLYVDQVCEREPALFPALLPLMTSGSLPARFLGRTAQIPANALVVASTPVCGCGGRGDPLLVCTCRPLEARRYQARWRRLLRYPFDLCLPIFPESAHKAGREGEAEAARARVVEARLRARARGLAGGNARLTEAEVFVRARWEPKAQRLWETLESRAGGNRENYLAVARVAVTLSDLRESEAVGEIDLLEALHYFPSAGAAGEGLAAPSGKSRSASAPLVNSTAMPNVRSP